MRECSTYLVSEPDLRLDLDGALHLARLRHRDLVVGHTAVLLRALAVEQGLALLGVTRMLIHKVRGTLIEIREVPANSGRGLGTGHREITPSVDHKCTERVALNWSGSDAGCMRRAAPNPHVCRATCKKV